MTAAAQALYLVGIGASAGGLEALLSLLFRLKPTNKIVYLIAQHMAHDAHSELVVQLLNRASALPVLRSGQVQQLEADHVYLIPAGFDGVVEGGQLYLRSARLGRLSCPSVDELFVSLAHDAGQRAVGVVLSGVGSDGAAGCRAINARGGMTFVQSLASAQYEGMPAAVIEAGAADYIFHEQEIPDELLALLPDVSPLPVQPRPLINANAQPVKPIKTQQEVALDIARLVDMLFKEQGIDFSGYKVDTLMRRVWKRKAVLGIQSMPDYFSYIAHHPDELTILQQQFLVSLSSFFRDRATFQVLEQVLRSELATLPDGAGICVWVPGCASGEEVYTLAIILHRLSCECTTSVPISIIGMDMNQAALTLAREGLYPQAAFMEMEEMYLDKYFTLEGLKFRVKPEIRKLCLFEWGDVLKGPHPHNVDVISCRNLLIYMKGDTQRQLLDRFTSALKPQGLLLLGQAESLDPAAAAGFITLDHAHRLYRKRGRANPIS